MRIAVQYVLRHATNLSETNLNEVLLPSKKKKAFLFFIGNRTFIQETENFHDGEHSKEETNTRSSRT